MNIFYLDSNPKTCAIMHVDKHCIKMILESAQLLCTAHRVLDGKMYIDNKTGRKIKRWELPEPFNTELYNATHINHPSALWTRQNKNNYIWLYNLFVELCYEYTYRYEKIHKCQQIPLFNLLKNTPKNINNNQFTEPTPAMPEKYIIKNNSIKSYHNYYINEKSNMFNWKNRQQPFWIS